MPLCHATLHPTRLLFLRLPKRSAARAVVVGRRGGAVVQGALAGLAFRAVVAPDFRAAPPPTVELAVAPFALRRFGAAWVFAPPPTACFDVWMCMHGKQHKSWP